MRISVIVPVYSVENYVEQCVRSICNQTIEDIEIIIVNDGSEDNSINKVKKIKDNRIKIINQENKGLSSARNKGLKYATGDYIAFVDSDDFIRISSAYEDMYNLAVKDGSDIVAGNCIWYYSDENNYPLPRDKYLFLFSPMNTESFMLACLKSNRVYAPVWLNLYKRDFILNNNLFFKEGIFHEDEEFTPRALLRANKVSIYNKDFYVYRQRQGSITHTFSMKRYLDIIEICMSLERELININNNELRMYFRKHIAEIAIKSIYTCKLEIVPKEVKQFISRNAVSKKVKIRSNILNLNSSLYFKLEWIYEILRKSYEDKYGKWNKACNC